MSWSRDIPTEEGWYLVYTGYNEKPFLRYFRCGKVFEDANCFVPTRSSPESYKAWLQVPRKIEDNVSQMSNECYYVLTDDHCGKLTWSECETKEIALTLVKEHYNNDDHVIVLKGPKLKIKHTVEIVE